MTNYVNSNYVVNNKVSWDRDIKISRKEVIVGRTCLHCGEIIGTNARRQYYHDECHRVLRNGRQKRYYKKQVFEPKYCVDCNKLLPEDKWNKKHVKRCGYCQYLYIRDTYSKKYNRPVRSITVGAECIFCGEFFPCKSINARYCKKCRDGVKKTTKLKKVSEREKSNIVREYKKKTSKPNSQERLGTYDTAYRYRQHYESNVCLKDGKPDFEAEQKLVNMLTKKTFKDRKGGYSPTEGDYKRGLVNEFKEG